ncbi:hypothetical protein OROMI_013755 [Orobanche minor]
MGGIGKMCATDPESAIYVTDSAEDIKNKINRLTFSVENHNIPMKYLEFFLEDDNELEHIRTEYGSDRMLTEEVLKQLIEVLTPQGQSCCDG